MVNAASVVIVSPTMSSWDHDMVVSLHCGVILSLSKDDTALM